MNLSGYRRATTVLAIACTGLVGIAVYLFVQYAPLRLRLMLATEQVEIFEAMRARAIQGGPTDAAGCLDYVVSYYPSGTKQIMGSRLDRLVEHARAGATREILAQLRTQTREDLGEDPQAWIQKYARRN